MHLSSLAGIRRSFSGTDFRYLIRGAPFRRAAFFILVAASTLAGAAVMFEILRANGTTVLEGVILALFTITFGWITVSFWTAIAGFLLRAWRIEPLTLTGSGFGYGEDKPVYARTAIVMPVYNEDTRQVLAGLEATWRSLAATGEAGNFDVFILSDTNKPEIAAMEERGWAALRRRLGADCRLFYRRREKNVGRKAGNVADFCRRWGQSYDFMLVLDADSVMSGAAILSLVRAMQATPGAGIIQTAPIPYGQATLFGRFTQFAARLYSPMLATGLGFWQMGEANYWGHNAIIRLAPFMSHCGLAPLPGRPPLGGEILSHDFVEAALMRRAGWNVYLMAELEGSYEGLPGNVLDFAKRDRRWAQGNLQHLKLLAMPRLHPLSRLHFFMGALAYGASLLWLLLLLFSSTDAILRAVTPHRFFASGYQLFPDWPVSKDGEIISLLAVTLVMLLLPKALGLALCLSDRKRRRGFGGVASVTGSAICEIAFSVIIAPFMMLLHAGFVMAVLAGNATGWGPQNRGADAVGWLTGTRYGALATLFGIFWGAVTWSLAPEFFWWLSPVLAGLLLAIPLIVLSSRRDIGQWLERAGVFLTPEEISPAPVLAAAAHRPRIAGDEARPERDMPVPPELPAAMPLQPLVAVHAA